MKPEKKSAKPAGLRGSVMPAKKWRPMKNKSSDNVSCP